MQRAPRGKKKTVKLGLKGMAELFKPARLEVYENLQIAGPSSIADLALRLGRPADSLYYHIRKMTRVGLLVDRGSRRARRRDEHLFDVPGRPMITCEPQGPAAQTAVLKSTSGADLLDPEALDILIHGIFPRVTILTPNLPEVEALVGQDFQTVERAAERILELGVGSVLIKGGHAEGSECRDIVTQLSAARGALDRVGFKLVAAALTDPDREADLEELEKLFLKLT